LKRQFVAIQDRFQESINVRLEAFDRPDPLDKRFWDHQNMLFGQLGWNRQDKNPPVVLTNQTLAGRESTFDGSDSLAAFAHKNDRHSQVDSELIDDATGART
jgi:hypothetical protein